jgi:hypothetical protein
MSFRRLKLPFYEVNWGGVIFKGTDIILIGSSAHYGQLVKVGNQYTKTEYTHVYPDSNLTARIYEATEPLPLRTIRELRHHFTRRIWMLDGVFECIEWQILNKGPQPKKPKLLPPVMCYVCMSEGNKFIPKQLSKYGMGLCRCCRNESVTLHYTRLGWPIDLRHKGFGFTVITTGQNWEMNTEYYKRHFDMSIYADYKG